MALDELKARGWPVDQWVEGLRNVSVIARTNIHPKNAAQELLLAFAAMLDESGWAVAPRQFLQALIPTEPTYNRDGPCCFELTKLKDGKERWIGQGCTCGNYDDAQSAASWADDMNRVLDFNDLCEKHKVDRAMISAVTPQEGK